LSTCVLRVKVDISGHPLPGDEPFFRFFFLFIIATLKRCGKYPLSKEILRRRRRRRRKPT